MAILSIAQLGHPVLRAPTRELTQEELLSDKWQGFIDDLIATMHEANGAGLAANQVHTSVRICAMEVRAPNPRYPYKPAIPLTVLVNPVITPIGEETFDNFEGCLSVPDLRGRVPRHARVRVQAWDRNAKPLDFEVAGVTAGTYQHEVDHLDGKLFTDRVVDPSSFCTWKMFDRHFKEAFVKDIEQVVERYGM